MPGIIGLVTKRKREWAEPQLHVMIDVLRHESFYSAGCGILDEVNGVYTGWIARKDSFSDGMPITNERGDVSLVFAGEEFPEPDTVQQLKEKGHEFRSEGASYLVHLYEDDPEFLTRLNGRFHGILTDRRLGTTTLFNDRYGLQRIYYHESKDALYFAAEAKAILAVCPELRRMDSKGMAEFISCGCVLENRTLFEGILVMPAGSAWIFRDGQLQKKASYFDPREWEEQSTLEAEAYYEQLKDIYSRNLPRYFNTTERIGMSLTGGIDTRMVMAWQKSPAGTLPCFSFGGPYRDCQDVIIARRVAQMCGQPYQVIPVAQEFLSQFPRYAERTIYLSDGCAEVNRASDLYANIRAREIAPVRMTGNYGSEVLRRTKPRQPNAPTPAFKPVDPMPGLFQPEVLQQIQAAKQTYAEMLKTNAASFAVFRQAPWHHYGLLTLEQTQLAVRTPFLDNEVVQTVFRAPQSALTDSNVCLRLISDGNDALGRIRTDRGLGGDRDGALGALTHWYLEFTFRAEYAYDYGMPQRIARVDHLLSPLHLERLFLGRHKFAHYRVWYRDPLAEYVREMLLDARSLSRAYVDRKMMNTVVNGHLKGSRNSTTEIHKLLSLELIQRLLLESR